MRALDKPGHLQEISKAMACGLSSTWLGCKAIAAPSHASHHRHGAWLQGHESLSQAIKGMSHPSRYLHAYIIAKMVLILFALGVVAYGGTFEGGF